MSAIAQMLSSFGAPAGPSIALVQQRSGAALDGSVAFVLPLADCLVAGAGTSAANGTYTYSGQSNGFPYFNKSGTAINAHAVAFVGTVGDDGQWYLFGNADEILYLGGSGALPWLDSWTQASGDSPAPTVTATNTVQAGNSVLVEISVDISAGTGFSVPPTLIGGVAPLLPLGVANEPVNNIALYNYYIYNSAITDYSGVTFTLSKSGAVACNASEWSGLADAGPEDTDTNTGDASPASVGPLTPVSTNNLLLASSATIADEFNGLAIGWTRMTPANVTGIFLESAYLIQTSASPATALWPLSDDVDWTAIGCAFGGA